MSRTKADKVLCTECGTTVYPVDDDKPVCMPCYRAIQVKEELEKKLCGDILEIGAAVSCDFYKGHAEDWHEGTLTYAEVSITHRTGKKAIGRIQWKKMTEEEVESALSDC